MKTDRYDIIAKTVLREYGDLYLGQDKGYSHTDAKYMELIEKKLAATYRELAKLRKEKKNERKVITNNAVISRKELFPTRKLYSNL